MKKLLFALTITALFISTTSFAQLNWQDNIGIYLDEAATTSCDVLPAVNIYPAYLVLTHLTSESVGGWEVKITSEGGGQFTSVAPRGDAINAATRQYEYIIGLGNPLFAVNGTLVIADMQFVISDDTQPFFGYLDAIYYDTLDNGLPAYLDGADPNIVKRLLPARGGLDNPQLAINNGECVVDNEDASFGAVKALFR